MLPKQINHGEDFSSLEVFWVPRNEKQNFCSQPQEPQPKSGHQWGRTPRTSTASCPFQGCAHTLGWAKQDNNHRLFSTQHSQSTVLFWGRYSSAFPRVISGFGIKRLMFGAFFPIIAKQVVWRFFPLYKMTPILTQVSTLL